jgi:integrase
LAEWTKHDYLHIARMFYRFMTKKEHPRGEEYLKPVPPKRMKRDTSQVFSSEEVEKLIDSALQVRFKAFISMTWEAGLRIEEALGLTVKEIVKETSGYRLHVDGKTGKRQPLIRDEKGWVGKRIDEVMGWPQDYFVFSKNGKDVPAYVAYWKMLKETGVRAKVSKPMRAHMLRHSRITYCANRGWTESELNAYFGWVQGSDMPRTYIHRDARSVDKRVLQEQNEALENVSKKQLEAALIDIMKSKSEFKKLILEMMQDGK